MVQKYFGNTVEKGWKIQFPQYGNASRAMELFYKYPGNKTSICGRGPVFLVKSNSPLAVKGLKSQNKK